MIRSLLPPIVGMLFLAALSTAGAQDRGKGDVLTSPTNSKIFDAVCVINETSLTVSTSFRWDTPGSDWQDLRLRPREHQWFFWKNSDRQRSPTFIFAFDADPYRDGWQTETRRLVRYLTTSPSCASAKQYHLSGDQYIVLAEN